jgi:hypothetical protein
MLARLYCRSSAALQGMLAPSACGRERPGLLRSDAPVPFAEPFARASRRVFGAHYYTVLSYLYCTLVYSKYIFGAHHYTVLSYLYCTLVYSKYIHALRAR